MKLFLISLDWKIPAVNKTLFLHIGLQKTGTTTIQTFLTKNRLLLAENGFVYPNPSSVRIGLDSLNHGHLSLSLNGYWRDTPHRLSREEAWGELRNLYFETDRHLLVSHEGLSTPQIEPHLGFIKKILGGIYVKAIIYLRRQDIFAQSVYKERLKANGKYGFHESYEHGDYRRLLDFYSILQGWQGCVGKDNVIVRIFEKEQLFEGDVLADFLHVTGTNEIAGLQRPSQHANPTMSRTVLEISRALNSMGIMGSNVSAFKLWLNNVLMDGQSNSFSEHNIISPKSQFSILKEYRSGNEKIARDFLGRADGQLFYEDLPDPDAGWQPYSGVPPEDVAKMLAAMFKKFSILD